MNQATKGWMFGGIFGSIVAGITFLVSGVLAFIVAAMLYEARVIDITGGQAIAAALVVGLLSAGGLGLGTLLLTKRLFSGGRARNVQVA